MKLSGHLLAFVGLFMLGLFLTKPLLGQAGLVDRGTYAIVEANDAFYAALNAMFSGDMAPMDAN